jgi:hypothetical protein
MPIMARAWRGGVFRRKGIKTASAPAMRAMATKLAGRSDRKFPNNPNDNAQIRDVISSADMKDRNNTGHAPASQCPWHEAHCFQSERGNFPDQAA